MANNCQACDDIRDVDPNLLINGLGSSECTSLKNDTGLVSSSGHNDCTDLEDLNDCLVKNMATEINSYNVCSWKDFMKALINNIWTVFKGIICAICGIWVNIHNLQTKTNDLCALVDQALSPSLVPYGTLPLAESTVHRCGSPTANVIKMPDDGTLNPYTKTSQNIGIKYASQTVTGCTNGQAEMLEWIIPDHYYYKLASGASSGDILWKISKTDAQNIIGISDFLWQTFTESSWTWHESILGDRQFAWMRLTIGENGLTANELGLVFLGCSAPNDPISSDTQISPLNAASARLYRHFV